MRKSLIWVVMVMVVLSCFSCGSSGGDGKTPPPTINKDITGVASKGPILGGVVTAFKIEANIKGQKISSAQTSATDGSYSIDLKGFKGSVLLEVSGGTYVDEATGETVDLKVVLRAVIPDASKKVTAAVTPLTELATGVAEKTGFSKSNISNANKTVSQLLGKDADILTIMPVDVTSKEVCDAAKTDQIEYSLMLAAISEMASEDGSSVESILTELKDDMTDDAEGSKLDTMHIRLSDALTDFVENNTNNHTGSTDVPSSMADAIEDAAEGFIPTGDLAEAKKMLLAVMSESNSDEERQENIVRYIEAMQTFYEPTPEAHLFIAIALTADTYYSDAFQTIVEAFGEKIDTVFDFDSLSEMDLKFAVLTLSQKMNESIIPVFSELETRLDLIDAEFDAASGATFSMSLAGFDTINFDSIDIQSLRALTKALKALCVYAQTIDYTVTEWNVNKADLTGTVDIRMLTEYTLAQEQEFIEKNSSFLSYNASATGAEGKLNDFKNSVTELHGMVKAITDAYEVLSDAQKIARVDYNVVSFESPDQFTMLKAFNDNTLTSLIKAFSDETEPLKYAARGYASSTSELEIKEAEGLACYTPSADIFISVDTYIPGYLSAAASPRTISVKDLFDGTKTLRDLIAEEQTAAATDGGIYGFNGYGGFAGYYIDYDISEPEIDEPDVIEPDVIEPDVIEPDVIESEPSHYEEMKSVSDAEGEYSEDYEYNEMCVPLYNVQAFTGPTIDWEIVQPLMTFFGYQVKIATLNGTISFDIVNMAACLSRKKAEENSGGSDIPPGEEDGPSEITAFDLRFERLKLTGEGFEVFGASAVDVPACGMDIDISTFMLLTDISLPNELQRISFYDGETYYPIGEFVFKMLPENTASK